MQWQNKDIYQVLRFVSGFALLVVGIRWLDYDRSRYLTGIAFVLWGIGLLWHAYIIKSEKRETPAVILETIGSLLSAAAFLTDK